MNLQQILAYADNVRRVMGRNVKDLVTDPANALSKTAANTLQTVQELPDSPSNFLGAGVTKSLRGPQHEAIRLAQQHAALPVEQHGLGLPPDNTPQMRADAQEWGVGNKEYFHLTPNDVTSFKLNADPTSHTGGGAVWLRGNPVSNPAAHQVSNAREVYKSGANDMPLVVNLSKDIPDSDLSALRSSGSIGRDFPFRISMDENAALQKAGYTHRDTQFANELAVLNPDNVRSRFAAFDPWRRNAAIATATGMLAPDLLAEELRKPQP